MFAHNHNIRQNMNHQPSNNTRRRVSFAPIVTLAAAGPLNFEELQECWYSPMELTTFKTQARKIAKGELQEEARGLEHVTRQRQQHRYMTIRCTLSAARNGMTGDQLEQVSRKCTKWNEEVAFVQACHDFADVYNPQMHSVIPAVLSTPPAFPFPWKKRGSAFTNNRRVRRRGDPIA